MSNRSLSIEYPADLLSEIKPEELERLAREAFYVRLCACGKISSGRAGAMLGMNRSDFLDLLGRYGVSYFDDQSDIAEDLHNAHRARP